MNEGDGNMIYYVDASGNVLGGTDSSDLNGITSLNGAAYAVLIDDATAQSTMQSATNATLQIQNLTPSGTNQYGIPTATGTLATVPIDPATLAAQQRQAITDKYTPLFASARQNYWNSVSDGQPLATQTKYQSTIKTLQTNQAAELAGVQG